MYVEVIFTILNQFSYLCWYQLLYSRNCSRL